ncbi:MAG: mevalonate kinase family protein [Gammaproteobacteria bacterium]
MQVIASAPGKLVLLGEYAVLEGAPALVMAVNRRAHVTLTETRGERIAVSAPVLGIVAECRLRAGGKVKWLGDARLSDQLRLVTAVLEDNMTAGVSRAFRAELDTDGFFLDAHGIRAKLGLGSSAALTVALAGALCVMQGRPALGVDGLVALHRRMQDGRGSGLDIAAARQGGVVIYRLCSGVPESLPVWLPQGLEWCAVWSGKPAVTGEFLRHIADWAVREPQRYNAIVARLQAVAAAGADAIQRADAGALMQAAKDYAAGLAELGTASGMDIVSREHREIANAAAACGVAYKSCGAGGGDAGIALSLDHDRLADFRQRIVQAGFRILDLEVDPQGLEARITNEHQ